MNYLILTIIIKIFIIARKILNYFPVEPKPLSPRVTTPLIS